LGWPRVGEFEVAVRVAVREVSVWRLAETLEALSVRVDHQDGSALVVRASELAQALHTFPLFFPKIGTTGVPSTFSIAGSRFGSG